MPKDAHEQKSPSKVRPRAPFNIFFSHFNLGSNLLLTKHNAVKYNIDSETST